MIPLNLQSVLVFSIGTFIHSWSYALSEGGKDEMVFTGYAYEPSNNALLYSEQHKILFDENGQRQHCTVNYFDPNGKRIAEKTLTYDSSGYLPNFDFIDLRSNQLIKVEKKKGYVSIEQGVMESLMQDQVPLLDDIPLIADAGFDVFMNQNWDELIEGKKAEVEFLAVTRGRFVTFEIERTRIQESSIHFRLSPANFVIAMLVDPILLEYDLNTGRILRYSGLTNLEMVNGNMPSGDNYVARIEYVYETQVSVHDNQNGVEE